MALSTSVAVTLLMGGMTLAQRMHEIRMERQGRQALLKESLAPLVTQIETAQRIEEIERQLLAFHNAYVERGYPDHQVVLREAGGRIVVSTLRGHPADPRRAFRASIPVFSPALSGGRGTLTVSEDASAYDAEVSRQWRSWWLHLGVTMLTIVLVLHMATRYLVTRPIKRLLSEVRKMEMGYWGDVAIPRGAWEIRWLAWRFRNMGIELQRTVRQCVAAERRAFMEIRPGSVATPDGIARREAGPRSASPNPECLSVYQHLLDKSHRLESLNPRDPGTAALAQEVWEQDAPEAGRLGHMALKGRLEDAALRVLEPKAFQHLEQDLAELKQSLAGWVERQEADLRNALEAHRIPYASLDHRVKHSAGVWRKMRAKGLTLEQVHDLFAYRIVVPTEPDCYWALGVVHQAVEPVVGRFRDYIVSPKSNGYQSLHTCLRSSEGPVFEVQIRSKAMDYHAERGPAAHWMYKAEQQPATSLSYRRIKPWTRLWHALSDC